MRVWGRDGRKGDGDGEAFAKRGVCGPIYQSVSCLGARHAWHGRDWENSQLGCVSCRRDPTGWCFGRHSLNTRNHPVIFDMSIVQPKNSL